MWVVLLATPAEPKRILTHDLCRLRRMRRMRRVVGCNPVGAGSGLLLLVSSIFIFYSVLFASCLLPLGRVLYHLSRKHRFSCISMHGPGELLPYIQSRIFSPYTKLHNELLLQMIPHGLCRYVASLQPGVVILRHGFHGSIEAGRANLGYPTAKMNPHQYQI